jgi:DNA-directed RNA polymerase sigma subunit (sigma70/sigma32)
MRGYMKLRHLTADRPRLEPTTRQVESSARRKKIGSARSRSSTLRGIAQEFAVRRAWHGRIRQFSTKALSIWRQVLTQLEL